MAPCTCLSVRSVKSSDAEKRLMIDLRFQNKSKNLIHSYRRRVPSCGIVKDEFRHSPTRTTSRCVRQRPPDRHGTSTVITILFVLFSVVALVIFFSMAAGAVPDPKDACELHAKLREFDLDAFLTLTDPADDQFLEAGLPVEVFRQVRRLRVKAALKYLNILYRNSAVLMKMGELAGASPDPSVAESGRILASTAFRTRVLVLRAYCVLLPELLLPWRLNNRELEVRSGYGELRRRYLEFSTIQSFPGSSQSI